MPKRPMLRGRRLTKIPRERHHYWPRCVSAFWIADDGKVSRLEYNGTLTRQTPINTARIADGHRIKFDGPWDATIEPLFDDADHHFPSVVTELLALGTSPRSFKSKLHERLLGQPISDGLRLQLGECLASLIVRSLGFREQLWRNTASARELFGFQDEVNRVEKTNLVVANMNQQYGGVKRALQCGGKFLVLFSEGAEFIFGEGFLSNISADTLAGMKCLVPLTPSMSVAFFAPTSYRTDPNLVTIRLSPEEVDLCNQITQVYTKDSIFFRNRRPQISDAFARREFLMFEYHQHEWLDGLLKETAAFRPNG